MGKKSFDAKTVLVLMLEAYKAGFHGPLELGEETCEEIMERAAEFGTPEVSDTELITKTHKSSCYGSSSSYYAIPVKEHDPFLPVAPAIYGDENNQAMYE